jgi:hypothetical protein
MGLNNAGARVPTFQRNAGQPEIPYRQQPWYAAYMAALFEADHAQMSERIRRAEQLILARERELLMRQSEIAEEQALRSAMHALQALASCLDL